MFGFGRKEAPKPTNVEAGKSAFPIDGEPRDLNEAQALQKLAEERAGKPPVQDAADAYFQKGQGEGIDGSELLNGDGNLVVEMINNNKKGEFNFAEHIGPSKKDLNKEGTGSVWDNPEVRNDLGAQKRMDGSDRDAA